MNYYSLVRFKKKPHDVLKRSAVSMPTSGNLNVFVKEGQSVSNQLQVCSNFVPIQSILLMANEVLKKKCEWVLCI